MIIKVKILAQTDQKIKKINPIISLLITSVIMILMSFSNNAYSSEAVKNTIIKTPSLTGEPIENIYSLSIPDREIYLTIFQLQKKARWKKINKLISKLDDKILVGHILYQRYMHPTAYNSTGKELRSWMLKYPDHPGARRIYALAVKKSRGRSSGIHSPYPDLADNLPLSKPITFKTTPINLPPKVNISRLYPSKQIKRKKSIRNEIKKIKRLVKKNLSRNRPNHAEKRLLAFEQRHILNGKELEELYGQISKKYYFLGKDQKALGYATYALSRNNEGDLSRTNNNIKWNGALSAWRLKKYSIAAQYFSSIADHIDLSKKPDPWFKAGAAFWAGRAFEKIDDKENSKKYFLQASSYPKTFYGLIAREKHGQEIKLNISESILTKVQANIFKKIPQINRAVALASLGQKSPADMELYATWKRSNNLRNKAFLTLASKLKLPTTQLKISQKEEKKHRDVADNHLYPLPITSPLGGYEVDRALLFAIMRQESGFNSWAKSSAGARGMMQLMPATAGYLMNDYRLRYGSSIKLDEADYNMALGQKYILKMMNASYVGGDLFKALTAYNAGPGNLRKWLRLVKHQNDPLLFIESIPYHETRKYIEHVLSNYWIYRSRLDQKYPSLKLIANYKWPEYIAQDQKTNKVAQNDN